MICMSFNHDYMAALSDADDITISCPSTNSFNCIIFNSKKTVCIKIRWILNLDTL